MIAQEGCTRRLVILHMIRWSGRKFHWTKRPPLLYLEEMSRISDDQNPELPELPESPESNEFNESDDTTKELRFGTTPNLLTLARMVFVPIVVGLLFIGEPSWDLVAAILFAIAAITDYFDGYIARVQKSSSVYGKLMDPLADKFLVVSSLVMLQYLDRIHPLIVIVLICRELAITGLRALASAEGVIIAASPSAKWKTASQMVAIPLIIVKDSSILTDALNLPALPLYLLGHILLYVSLAISLWSARDYIVGFFRGVREKRRLITEQRKAARKAAKRQGNPVV